MRARASGGAWRSTSASQAPFWSSIIAARLPRAGPTPCCAKYDAGISRASLPSVAGPRQAATRSGGPHALDDAGLERAAMEPVHDHVPERQPERVDELRARLERLAHRHLLGERHQVDRRRARVLEQLDDARRLALHEADAECLARR